MNNEGQNCFFSPLYYSICMCVFSCMCAQSCLLFSTLRTVAHQAPLFMEFSRQEYWSGLPFPSPGDLPDPRIKPMSPAFPALAGRFFSTTPPGKPIFFYVLVLITCLVNILYNKYLYYVTFYIIISKW